MTELIPYIAAVRDHMNLSHWTIDLSDEPPPDDAFASIEPIEGRYRATLRLAPYFLEKPTDAQRDSIVHELLHLVLASMVDVVRVGAWREQVGQSDYDIMWQEFRRQMEYAVDHLTRVVARDVATPDDAAARLAPQEPGA